MITQAMPSTHMRRTLNAYIDMQSQIGTQTEKGPRVVA